MREDIYQTPLSSLDSSAEGDTKTASKALKISAVILTIPNIAAGFYQQYEEPGGNFSQVVVGVLGTAIFAAIVVLLFQIGERFRNERSRYKIFMWCQISFFVLMSLSTIIAFIQYTNHAYK